MPQLMHVEDNIDPSFLVRNDVMTIYFPGRLFVDLNIGDQISLVMRMRLGMKKKLRMMSSIRMIMIQMKWTMN